MEEYYFTDYYYVLGVRENATKEEIKKAYFNLSKKTHVDSYARLKLTEKEKDFFNKRFSDITEAYRVLSDDELRREYDIKRKRHIDRLHRIDIEIDNFKRDQEEFKDREPKKDRNRNNDNSFTGRHRTITNYYNRKKERNANTKIDNLKINIEKGLSHILSEFAYRGENLKINKKDSVGKYIYRNALPIFIATSLAIGGISYINLNHNEELNNDNTDPIEVPASTPAVRQDYILTRIHKVVVGDTYSQYEYDANIPIDEILRINGKTGTGLYVGETVRIPYMIDKDDIQYYTMLVSTEGLSIGDLATIYETTVPTLYELNKEIMVPSGNSYVILSDTIIVPNFISRDEYKEIKSRVQTYA